MKRIFMPCAVALLTASAAISLPAFGAAVAEPAIHASESDPKVRIDFEDVKDFKWVSQVKAPGFSLEELHGRKVLYLTGPSVPGGNIKGRYLAIGRADAGSVDVLLLLNTSVRDLSLDYVLREPGAETPSFFCHYAVNDAAKDVEKVAASMADGRATCSAPEGKVTKGIIMVVPTNGPMMLLVDNIVGN